MDYREDKNNEEEKMNDLLEKQKINDLINQELKRFSEKNK